jgi:hypothetical protein
MVTPAEARRIARDYVAKVKALPAGTIVRVSDFGELADGSYSVLVDVMPGTRAEARTRYRVKMDKRGKITSFISR